MIITTEGVIIRMTVNNISILKRITSGVKLVQLGENTQVASFARIKADMIEENEEEGESEAEDLTEEEQETAESAEEQPEEDSAE